MGLDQITDRIDESRCCCMTERCLKTSTVVVWRLVKQGSAGERSKSLMLWEHVLKQ